MVLVMSPRWGLEDRVRGARGYKEAGPKGLRAPLKTEGLDRICLAPLSAVPLGQSGGSMTFHTRSKRVGTPLGP